MTVKLELTWQQLGLTSASVSRLSRIAELNKSTQMEALEYSISVGWLEAEKRTEQKRVKNDNS